MVLQDSLTKLTLNGAHVELQVAKIVRVTRRGVFWASPPKTKRTKTIWHIITSSRLLRVIWGEEGGWSKKVLHFVASTLASGRSKQQMARSGITVARECVAETAQISIRKGACE